MRSHWTNPTIIRRSTIAALSAAGLLLACDQPTGPSRAGRGILADAQSGTVSAHGSGTVPGGSCILTPPPFVCDNGGTGVKFSFDFSGPNASVALVSGDWSATDPKTGVQILSTVVTATLTPSLHQLAVSGMCVITTPDGTSLPGTCILNARDLASSGGVDIISFNGMSTNGNITAGGQLASGNINID